MDYTSGPYTVTIPAGQTTATFNIPIINDDILEIDENLMLTINSSLPDGVTRGTPSEATVTIVDDDRKLLLYKHRLATYMSTLLVDLNTMYLCIASNNTRSCLLCCEAHS